MNHHKFNYLSTSGVGNCSKNNNYHFYYNNNSVHAHSARRPSVTHIVSSPIGNTVSALPTSASPSSLTTTTNNNATISNTISNRTTVATNNLPSRYPIRLTPFALPYFVSTIIYTIEFHAPVGPRPLPLSANSVPKSSSLRSNMFFNSSARSSLPSTRSSSTALNEAKQSNVNLGRGISPANNNNNDNYYHSNCSTNTSFAENAIKNALPSSVFSAVSAIFGRTPLQSYTPRFSPHSCNNNNNKSYNNNNNNNNERSMNVNNTTGHAFTDNDESSNNKFNEYTTQELHIDESVIRRSREQPLVSPCTQIIHELGNIHIVVRERHNPTVETAYNQALCDIRMILNRQREKMEKELRMRSQSQQHQKEQRLRSELLENRRTEITTNSSTTITKATAASIAEESVYGEKQKRDYNYNCYEGEIVMVPSLYNQEEEQEEEEEEIKYNKSSIPCHFAISHKMNCKHSSSRESGSPLFMFSASPTLQSSVSPSLKWLSSSTVRNSSDMKMNVLHGEYDVQPNEIGMELSVRLLTRESKWILMHERPLAEWTFPIIRTCDEETVKFCGKSHNSNTKMEQNRQKKNSEVGMYSKEPLSSNTLDDHMFPEQIIHVNNGEQIQDVLQFILKTFYDAISLQTFVDFTSGELVFDARVTERRSFSEM